MALVSYISYGGLKLLSDKRKQLFDRHKKKILACVVEGASSEHKGTDLDR